MTCFPDTSFLCSLYRLQIYSPVAIAWNEQLEDPLPVFLTFDSNQKKLAEAEGMDVPV